VWCVRCSVPRKPGPVAKDARQGVGSRTRQPTQHHYEQEAVITPGCIVNA